MRDENKNMSPMIHTMLLVKAGMWASERLSIDIYSMIQFINLIIPTLDVRFLKEDYEKKYGVGQWDKDMKKLKKINMLVSESKAFYDGLTNTNKTFVKKTSIQKRVGSNIDEEVQKSFKRYFYKTASRINLLQEEINRLFVFLTMESPIQRGIIKNEYLQNFDSSQSKKVPPPPRPN